ncbi:MAG: hypothetical protein ACPG43_05950 [Alcanivoracaceae bacterium]
MKDKLVAAGIHLLFSALIVASLVAVVMWAWFPGPLSRIEGVTIPLKILVIVDVILGPMLTFVVFKRDKPSLKKDLGVIIALQLAAFGYGGWVMYQARTAVLAWDSGNVYSVRAGQTEGEPIPDWVTPVPGLHGTGLVYVEKINDPDFIAAVLRGDQADVTLLPAQYRPVSEHVQEIVASAPDIAKLLAEPAMQGPWQAFAERHGVSRDEVIIVPLLGAHADAGVVLRREDAGFVGLLDVDVRRVLELRKVRKNVPGGKQAGRAGDGSGPAA